jgi:hypothetical protein
MNSNSKIIEDILKSFFSSIKNLGSKHPLVSIGFLLFIFFSVLIAGGHRGEVRRRIDICRTHQAFYLAREDYYGLLACRKLSDHSLFYVVRETGMALYSHERND